GATATPQLAATLTSWPSITMGSAMLAITRRARSTAFSGSATSGHKIANSSPPIRAAVSAGAVISVRRWATSCKIASPTLAPKAITTNYRLTVITPASLFGIRLIPRLQRKLLLIFMAALLISVVLAAMIAVNFRIEREYRAMARESAGRLQVITSLTSALYQAESSHRAFAASGASVFEGELRVLHQLLDEHLVSLGNVSFVTREDES